MDVQLITRPELLKLVPYTIRHIYRMEKAGKFPARVKVGANRVAWVQSEVLRWLELRVTGRTETASTVFEQPAH
jgi:prophage regulatory protein